METIHSYFNTLGIDFDTFWKAGLILLLGTLVLSIFGRFIFGKRSALNHAISSAIGILFIYGLTFALKNTGLEFQAFTAPLPFVTLSGDQLVLFSFQNADYLRICSELLNMIILAFLVNLVDGWIPRGKNIITWLLFRCLTVAIAYALHLLTVGLLTTYLPEGIVIYAPIILLAILALLLLTGALKILVGALLSTVNPIIGGLYTFFFANIIGKQVTKAVLTTLILAALVIGLQYAGIYTIPIVGMGIYTWLPILAVLLVLWYIIIRIF